VSSPAGQPGPDGCGFAVLLRTCKPPAPRPLDHRVAGGLHDSGPSKSRSRRCLHVDHRFSSVESQAPTIMLPAQLGSLNPFPLKPRPTRQQTQDLRNLCWQQVVARNAKLRAYFRQRLSPLVPLAYNNTPPPSSAVAAPPITIAPSRARAPPVGIAQTPAVATVHIAPAPAVGTAPASPAATPIPVATSNSACAVLADRPSSCPFW
jgi:hypothetical protein